MADDHQPEEGATPKPQGRGRWRRKRQPSGDAPALLQAAERELAYPVRAMRTGKAGHGWAESNDWMPVYLRALMKTGNRTRACEVAKITHATVRKRRQAIPEFGEACDEAMEVFRDRMVATGWDMAVNGSPIVAYDKERGQHVVIGHRKDSVLFMFMLKQLDPSFRENYRPPEEDKSQGFMTVFAKWMQGFDPNSDEQASEPSLDEFIKADRRGLAGPTIDVTPEPPADEIARLKARLAELEAANATRETET